MNAIREIIRTVCIPTKDMQTKEPISFVMVNIFNSITQQCYDFSQGEVITALGMEGYGIHPVLLSGCSFNIDISHFKVMLEQLYPKNHFEFLYLNR